MPRFFSRVCFILFFFLPGFPFQHTLQSGAGKFARACSCPRILFFLFAFGFSFYSIVGSSSFHFSPVITGDCPPFVRSLSVSFFPPTLLFRTFYIVAGADSPLSFFFVTFCNPFLDKFRSLPPVPWCLRSAIAYVKNPFTLFPTNPRPAITPPFFEDGEESWNFCPRCAPDRFSRFFFTRQPPSGRLRVRVET